MSPQIMNKETKEMHIASCRICLLSKSNCATCPLNWALKVVKLENSGNLGDLNIAFTLKTSPEFASIYDPKI